MIGYAPYLIALLVLLAAAISAAVIGVALRPRPAFEAAERGGLEDLQHCRSLAPSGDRRVAAGRRYASPLLASSLPKFFRRAL